MNNTKMPIKKILVIDDDEDVLVIVKYSLEHLPGATILCVTSGKAGVQEARNFLPDIILLDVMMPEMDGLETLKQIRSISQIAHVPIIVLLTAKILERDLEYYYSLGICDVIKKPFDPLTLSARIQEIWRRN